MFFHCNRCGITVESARDRLGHIPCNKAGCELKPKLRAYYFRRFVDGWGWLIAVLGCLLIVAVGPTVFHALAVVLWGGMVGLFYVVGGLLLFAFGLSLLLKLTQARLSSRLAYSATLAWAKFCSLVARARPNPPEVPPVPDLRPASSSAVRDKPIGLALAYICFRRWGPSFLQATEANLPASEAALKDFRRAAADGRVQIWGKRHNSDDFELIEKAYWRVHTFEWLGLLKGRTITERADGGRRDTSTEYLDLMTSETQVEAFWPP